MLPHRRPVRKGSFGGHFDELVVVFPDPPEPQRRENRGARTADLQERIYIHAKLFKRAWQLDE